VKNPEKEKEMPGALKHMGLKEDEKQREICSAQTETIVAYQIITISETNFYVVSKSQIV
jgi:hypothetical protein